MSKRIKNISTKTESESLNNALLKKAMGYTVEESVLEYSCNNENDMVLNKKKVTNKYYPPDFSALSALMSNSNKNYEMLSDEELEKEALKIISEILKIKEVENDN